MQKEMTLEVKLDNLDVNALRRIGDRYGKQLTVELNRIAKEMITKEETEQTVYRIRHRNT